jgi:hypothetical protein
MKTKQSGLSDLQRASYVYVGMSMFYDLQQQMPVKNDGETLK